MAQRIIQIKKKAKPEPKPKPKRNIVINKPQRSTAPPPEPKPKRNIIINKPQKTSAPTTKRNTIIKKPQKTAKPSLGGSATNNPRLKLKSNRATATSTPRVATKRPATTKPRKRKAKPNPMAVLIPIGIAVLVIVILTVIVSKNTRKPTQRRASSDYIEQDDTPDDRMLARIALTEVKEWQKDNPEKYDGIIAKYQEIIDKYPNELAAKTAARSIFHVEREIQKLIDTCMAELTQKCKALIKHKEYEEAIAAFMDYDGEYAAETEEKRHANAEKIRNLLQKNAAKTEVNVLDQALATLLKDGIEEADVFVILHSKKDEKLLENQEWQQLTEAINAAKIIPELLLESFKKQIGETITVDLVTGSIKIQVSDVKNGKIQHFKRAGRAKIINEIPIDSLSNKEQLRRLKDNLSGIALEKAVEATLQSDFVTAKKYLQLTPSPLKERILNMLDESQLSKMASIASLQISRSLWMAGIKVTPSDNFNAALVAIKTSNPSLGMKLLLYSIAKDVKRYSYDLDWYKEKETNALMTHLLSFKPVDGEDLSETHDDSLLNENDDNQTGIDNTIDESQIDWRKEIDF